MPIRVPRIPDKSPGRPWILAPPSAAGLAIHVLRQRKSDNCGICVAEQFSSSGAGCRPPATGHERVDVLPGRTTDLVGEWLRDHPGIQVMCRDGSGAYGEAARQALQVRHLWHGLAETTLERWQQVHDLLGKNVGLLECARRLQLSLNAVQRYARADQPERLQRAPQYRATLDDSEGADNTRIDDVLRDDTH